MGPAAVRCLGIHPQVCEAVAVLVAVTGHETKVFKNATDPPSKRSRIERQVDYIIFFMFALLAAFCITSSVYFSEWTRLHMNTHWYLAPYSTPVQYNPSKPGLVGLTQFITAFILYGGCRLASAVPCAHHVMCAVVSSPVAGTIPYIPPPCPLRRLPHPHLSLCLYRDGQDLPVHGTGLEDRRGPFLLSATIMQYQSHSTGAAALDM